MCQIKSNSEKYDLEATNGILRYENSVISHVRFGNWKYYNGRGELIKIVNEDLKFGRVKPLDVIEFIERRGIFNRQTGETIFYPNKLSIRITSEENMENHKI